MPNLVGIGLSQVPTNSMLGGLAYQDPEHASIKDLDLKNLSQINSEIAETAVDIFIYDTSKDSDGGAWRKRTTHTSWYNETLGTATRGTRREFPSVAVLVYGSGFINIYDGDDPDLPMWMTFDSSIFETFVTDIPTSISMLNGVLVWGCKHTNSAFAQNNLVICNFISEKTERISHAGNNYSGTDRTGIVNRNVWNNISTWIGNRPLNLVNYYINDVAMTVLPNAPIDSATGIPRPTIAVATDGGLSVIRDDGDVFDIVYTNNEKTVSVAFNSSGNLHFVQHDNDVTFANVPIPTQDYANGTAGNLINLIGGSAYHTGNSVSGNTQSAILGDVVNDTLPNAMSGPSGLTFISNETPTGYLQGAVSYATTSYNTGWMHGDIKGAFLSDTDTTNATDSNVVTNGTFDSNTSGWSGDSGAAISWDSGGFASVGNGGGDNTFAIAQTGILVSGAKYRVTGRVQPSMSGSYEFRVRAGGAGTQWNMTSGLTNGQWYSFDTGIITADGTVLEIGSQGGTITNFYLDDVYVWKLEEEDRSVNNTGLVVHGTVTKSAVATGAELVAYSGFSASNHLRQPPNSSMNIGTGDAYEMIWFKTTSTSGTMMLISYEGGAIGTNDYGKPFNIRYENGSVRGWASHNAFTTFDDVNHGISTADGNWHHAAWVKRGQVFELYVDGEFIGSDTGSVGSNALSDANSELVIGARKRGKASGDSEEPWHNGSLALARIGKSAPSAEQIKKIYGDEKVLFQENAACTLYGSSDDIKALAYDESTEQLHVGTSSGRSDFQGLRRINNTTTAVTTAISSHDEFIVEQ